MDSFWNVAEFSNQTQVHPLGIAVVLVACISILTSKRASAVLPILVIVCFIAPAQRVVLGAFDFSFIRLVLLAGVARVFFRGEVGIVKWNTNDLFFLLWLSSNCIIYSILWSQMWTVTNRLGAFVEAMSTYVVARSILRTRSDLRTMSFWLTVISIPVAIMFLVENTSRYNVFSIFGGVPDFTVVRAGRLRCQGAFSHPILAGTFWAAVLPFVLFLAYYRGLARVLSCAGVLSIFVIVYACASSTPVLGLAACFIAVLSYPLRRFYGQILCVLLMMAVLLHFIMKAPVWHLLSRISAVGGSTGYHRYALIDAAITNFSDWAIAGCRSTADWGPGLRDVTNQYILQGMQGGILTLLLFLTLIGLSFRNAKKIICSGRFDTELTYFAFAVFVSVFVHCCCFIGVSYFGQINVLWYMTLAVSATLGEHYCSRVPSKYATKPNGNMTR